MKRRDLLSACGAVTVTGVAGCGAPQGDQPSEDERPAAAEVREWPMFLYDSYKKRCFAGEFASDNEPSEGWSYETGDAVWSSPVIADGTVYVGSYDGHLYALSAESGELLWRYRTGDRIDGTPAVANGAVFVGSFDRNIYALDAKTGEERWIYGTKGIVRSSPTVRDGTVYFGAHCRAEECGAYYDVQWPEVGYVYAIDAETGDLRWRYETGDGVVSSPAVDGETVYVGSSDNALYAIDAFTGETRWRYETDASIMSSPVYVDGRLYVGTVGSGVYAIDAEDGEARWKYDADKQLDDGIDLSAVITGTPTVCDGTVYVGSIVPGDEVYGELHAISAADGTREWSESPFGQAIGSSPTVVNETIYFGAHTFGSAPDANPGVYALDTDRTEQWSYTVDAEEHRGFGSSPAIVDATLYVGGSDGRVYAFELN